MAKTQKIDDLEWSNFRVFSSNMPSLAQYIGSVWVGKQKFKFSQLHARSSQ